MICSKRRVTYIWLLFVVFSVVGWVYEIVNHVLAFNQLQLRASLAGPWCPIYGVGGLLIIAAFKRFTPLVIGGDTSMSMNTRTSLSYRARRVIAFVGICAGIYVLTTVVELAGAYVCELMMSYVPWDYSDCPGNWRGIIAHAFTIRFVIGGVVFLFFIEPAIEKFCRAHQAEAIRVAMATFALFSLDCALEAAGVWSRVLIDGRRGWELVT